MSNRNIMQADEDMRQICDLCIDWNIQQCDKCDIVEELTAYCLSKKLEKT